MATTLYMSSDASAPALNGTAGSLITVLQQCLVTGYGAKAGAGWTMPYTGTNRAAFKQGAGSSGFYLDVNDSLGNYANIVGYITMSAVATGTNPFPPPGITQFDTEINGCLNVIKQADGQPAGTAVGWVLVADSRTFYLFTLGTGQANRWGAGFGDFESAVPVGSQDPYACMIVGEAKDVVNVGARCTYFGGLSQTYLGGDGGTGNFAQGLWFARNGYGSSGAQLGWKFTNSAMANIGGSGGMIGTSGFPYPMTISGGLQIDDIRLSESVQNGTQFRGRLRGLQAPLHNRPLSDGDTFSGASTGSLTGQSFMALNLAQDSQAHYAPGQIIVQTTNWA